MPQRLFPNIDQFEHLVSGPRFGTYLKATAGNRQSALLLYCWNTEVSAALFKLLQYCEVAVRNGAVLAVEQEFGPNWHLNRGFHHSLVELRRGYNPKKDLEECGKRNPTAGKVVAELKFAFWKYLFVKGQDHRLWLPHFDSAFPGSDPATTVSQRRS